MARYLFLLAKTNNRKKKKRNKREREGNPTWRPRRSQAGPPAQPEGVRGSSSPPLAPKQVVATWEHTVATSTPRAPSRPPWAPSPRHETPRSPAHPSPSSGSLSTPPSPEIRDAREPPQSAAARRRGQRHRATASTCPSSPQRPSSSSRVLNRAEAAATKTPASREAPATREAPVGNTPPPRLLRLHRPRHHLHGEHPRISPLSASRPALCSQIRHGRRNTEPLLVVEVVHQSSHLTPGWHQ